MPVNNFINLKNTLILFLLLKTDSRITNDTLYYIITGQEVLLANLVQSIIESSCIVQKLQLIPPI